MERTKAEFRAIRETLGIPQQTLASMLGVNPLSVKRWELPKYPQHAPEGVWEVLYALLEEHTKAIRQAAAIDAESVDLPYWMTSDDFEQYATDDEPGTNWTQANATRRAIAQELALDGIAVYWHDAAEDAR